MMPKQLTDAPSPVADPIEPEQRDQVELQIDESGGFLVLSSEAEFEPLGKQSLISSLRTICTEDKDLMIKVQNSAQLQSLVDGMDSATIAGFQRIEVTQVEFF